MAFVGVRLRRLGGNGRPDKIGATGSSSGAHQAMLLGMRPQDPRYAALPLPAGAAAVDGSLGCVVLCSPVIDPLGRYHYAKGLRQDCTPPDGFLTKNLDSPKAQQAFEHFVTFVY